ncbi:MAG: hypothetical protein V1844_21905 [Pseudomonadota bacterium]
MGVLDSYMFRETVGDWVEYDFDDIVSHIKSSSGVEDIDSLENIAAEARELFEEIQSELLSLVTPVLRERQDDTFLTELVEKIKEVRIYTPRDYRKSVLPSGQMMSRDMNAIQAGNKIPPHISVLSSCFGTRAPFNACLNLSKYTRRLASHLENVDMS